MKSINKNYKKEKLPGKHHTPEKRVKYSQRNPEVHKKKKQEYECQKYEMIEWS